MKHVILGAGPVGISAASALSTRGNDVVLISRARPLALPAGVSHSALDVHDTPAVSRVSDGAAVVYQCLNAPYHRWQEVFPGLQRAAVAAARAARARYVSFENVYMYGAPGSAPFVESQPHAPCSDKGAVRAVMVDELRHLHQAGDLHVTHVRASDLFGPGMRGSALGEEFVGRATAAKGARGLGDLDAVHTWTFTQDAGETLAMAGSSSSKERVWHVPSDSPRSQRAVAAELSRLLGRDVPLAATPGWLLRLVGLFRPEVAALIEMAYEFDREFVVDDKATRAGLGVPHTPFAEALATTVAWYRSAAASSRA